MMSRDLQGLEKGESVNVGLGYGGLQLCLVHWFHIVPCVCGENLKLGETSWDI